MHYNHTMMSKAILLGICLMTCCGYMTTSHAQNLVMNPSFEQNLGCPSTGNISDLGGWFSPTDGTPNYFSCPNTPGSFGVPVNQFGQQPALTDSSYAGFVAYDSQTPNSREYLGIALDQALTIGQTYCVSFNVSRAEFTHQAVANLGLYFDTTQINMVNGSSTLGFTPQISSDTSQVIIASADNEWVTINGTFTADQAYTYLYIGNFDNDANTNVQDLTQPGVGGAVNLAYYFVDDVAVTALTGIDVAITVDGGQTTNNDSISVCVGDSITLIASTTDNVTYEWVNANDPFTPISTSDTLGIIANNDLRLVVRADNGICLQTDTITIQAAPTPNVAFFEVSNCAGYLTQFFDVSTNVADGATYQWGFDTDGDNNPDDFQTTLGGASYEFPNAGTFAVILTITNPGGVSCSASDTLMVDILGDCDPCVSPMQERNIVPNPNIEIYTTCPDTLSEFMMTSQVSFATPWVQPTAATSDFFHACSADNIVGVPNNFYGNQAGLSGNGYLGFHAYGTNYREYVSVPLLETLEAGKNYCVTFNVSLADETGVAVNHLGAYFSDNAVNSSTTATLPFIPQVQTDSIIRDQNNWTPITGVFQATGTEGWLTIGNFTDDLNSDTSQIGGMQFFEDRAYYYLDDISVVEVPDLVIRDTANVAIDSVAICVNDSITLVADGEFCGFTWTDVDNPDNALSFDNTITVKSTTSGIKRYVVKGNFGDCSVTDTVMVFFEALPMPNFDIDANCAGAITSFTNTSTNVGDGAFVQWTFGDGDTLINPTGVIQHLYDVVGIYNIELVIVNPTACRDTLMVAYEVTEECDPCNLEANLVVNASFEDGGCPTDIGQIDSLTAWSSVNSNVVSSQCDSEQTVDCINGTGNGVVMNLENIVTNADNTTTYRFTVTNLCTPAFFWTAFELPVGFDPINPTNGTTYSGMPTDTAGNPIAGIDYTVTIDPPEPAVTFHSIFFEVSGGSGIQAGETDFFEFTMPADAPILMQINALSKVSNAPNAIYPYTLSTTSFTNPENCITTASAFDNCSNNPNASTPDNAFGMQTPHMGDAYAGLLAYSRSSGGITPTEHQFITTPLSQPLDSGQVYCVKMFVSLAEGSDYAIDQLDMYLSTDAPTNATDLIMVEPQINSDTLLSNFGGWTQVAVNFTADAAYQHLTIGNFEVSPDSINTLLLGANNNGIAYYYIDDVSIIPLTIEAQEDVAICAGDTTTLTAVTNTCNFYWTTADGDGAILSLDTALTVSPNTTTTYVFVGNDGVDCLIRDSVTVIVRPLPVVDFITPNSLVCDGESITLEVSGQADSIVWATSPDFAPNTIVDDGQAPASTLIVTPGQTTTYYVLLIDALAGCQTMAQTTVTFALKPMANIAQDTIRICTGETIRLQATGGDTYSWNPANEVSDPNISDPLVSPTDTTTFIVTVSNSNTGCSDTDAVVVIPIPEFIAPPTDTVQLCTRDSLVLSHPAIPTDAVSYSWSPATDLSNDTLINPTTFTTTDRLYTLTFQDSIGCTGQISIFVDVKPIPSAGSDVQICENGSTQLNASGGGATYAWSPTDGLDDPNSQNPVASPLVTTTYVVTVTYAEGSGSCRNTDTVTVFVNSTGFAEAGDDQTICPSDTAQLNAIGGNAYAWYPNENITDTTLANPQAFPSTTTTYFVDVTNLATGCVSTDSVTIFVTAPSQPIILTQDSLLSTPMSFETEVICLDIDYEGCEGLDISVNRQFTFGSNIVFVNDTCFEYTSAFSAGQSDTIQIIVCTDQTSMCDTITHIFVRFDEPPMWTQDAVMVSTCIDAPIAIPLPDVIDPDGELDALFYNITMADSGVAVLMDDTIFYTPDPDRGVFLDIFEVIVCDSLYPSTFFPGTDPHCDTLKVFVDLVANDAPTVDDATASLLFNNSATVCLAINDPDGDNLTTNIIDLANNGAAVLNNDSCVTYTPNPGFVGSDTVIIEVCDQCLCDQSVVVFEVFNNAPIVNDTTLTIPFETPLQVCLDITEPDGNDFTTNIISQPANGTVNPRVNVEDSCVLYVPDMGFSGVDTFTLSVCDEINFCTDVLVTINVLSQPNDPPVADDISVTIPFEQLEIICLNVVDPDGDDTQAFIVTSPANGTGTVGAANPNCVVYEPNTDFAGMDTIILAICDDDNECDTANVFITVEPSLPPMVQDTSVATIVNQPRYICLDIVEPNGDAFTLDTAMTTANGSVNFVNNNDTCLVYIPNQNFTGIDSVIVEVCDDNGSCSTATIYINVVDPPNMPPVVNNVGVATNFEQEIIVCMNIFDPNDDPFTFDTTNLGGPTNGSLTFVDNFLCITYTPDAGFTGRDTIDIISCDPDGACDVGQIFIQVFPNEPPEADNVNVTVTAGEPTQICVPATDPENQALTIDPNTLNGPNSGTFQLDTGTCIIYTAALNFTGMDAMTVRVCDTENVCDTIAILIDVVPPMNAPPVILSEDTLVNTDFEAPINICLEVTDPDGDSSEFTTIIVTDGMNGSALPAQDVPCLLYTPNPEFSGLDSVEVAICDPVGACDTTTVLINVGLPANAAPIFNDTTVVIVHNTETEVCLHFSDPNGDAVTINSFTNPVNGTIVAGNNSDSCVVYTPNDGFVGLDSVVVTVCDPQNACTNATLTFNVQAPDNQAPTVEDTSVTTLQGVPIQICLNITDPDGDPTAIENILTNPINGGVMVDNDSCLTYTPNANFTGTDIIEAQVCDDMGNCTNVEITIGVTEPNNNPPIISSEDTTVTTDFNEPIVVCLIAADPEGSDLTTFIVADFNGDAGATGDSTCVEYMPNPNFSGLDSIVVAICDESIVCDTTTIFINVLPEDNVPPVAEDEMTSTNINTDIEVCITATDANINDALSIAIDQQAMNGTAVVSNVENLCINYTPNTNFTGSDSLTVLICDLAGACDTAKIVIEVVPINQEPEITNTPDPAPVMIGETATACFTAVDPDGDALSYNIVGVMPAVDMSSYELINDTCIQFTPPAGSTGSFNFEVEVCDNGIPIKCATTTIIFVVNNPPMVNDTMVATLQGEEIEVCLDISDIDGDTDFTLITTTNPANGNILIGTNGCFTYEPDPMFVGVETIVLNVCDDSGACTSVTITITVTDALTAVDDAFDAEENITIMANVSINDLLPDEEDKLVTLIDSVDNGSLTLEVDGTFSYTSDNDFVGVDSFTYQICDLSGLGCDTATVYITVTDRLMVADDGKTINEDEATTINILVNDGIPDDFTVTDEDITIQNDGAAAISYNEQTGELNFVPPVGFIGVYTFTYTICFLPELGCETATVTIIVNEIIIINPPTGADDAGETEQGETVIIDILANDADNNGIDSIILDLSSIVLLDDAANGTVNLDDNNMVIYIPNPSFFGIDTFQYVICNTVGFCDTATVIVQVNEFICALKVYSVITPNGDNLNDEFVIDGIECDGNDQNELIIYNRWGNIVFEETNYGQNGFWDGTFRGNGDPLPDGTYFYILRFSNREDLQGYVEVYR